MRRSLSLLALLLVTGAPALAQIKNTDAPVDITADGQEVDLKNKVTTYSGNVIVIQGDMRMRADAVRAEMLDDSNLNKIVANGHVVLDSPSGTITGDAGTWDFVPHMITFTGRVVLTKDKDVLRGTVLNYNLDTKQAKFTARGGRVQGLFSSPQSKPNP